MLLDRLNQSQGTGPIVCQYCVHRGPYCVHRGVRSLTSLVKPADPTTISVACGCCYVLHASVVAAGLLLRLHGQRQVQTYRCDSGLTPASLHSAVLAGNLDVVRSVSPEATGGTGKAVNTSGGASADVQQLNAKVDALAEKMDQILILLSRGADSHVVQVKALTRQ